MEKNVKLITLLLIFGMSSIAFGEESITLVGLNGNKEEFSKDIPRKYLKKRTKTLIRIFESSLQKSANKNVSRSKKWQLQSIEVGPSIEASIGIGDIIRVGGIAGFKLMFERQ